jgi:hypothetical protein
VLRLQQRYARVPSSPVTAAFAGSLLISAPLGIPAFASFQRYHQDHHTHQGERVLDTDVPTARESGLSNFVAASWNGLAAPARTPRPVIERLQREVVAALANPDVRRRLADLNVEAQSSSPEQAAALLASEVRRWGDVIVRARIPQQ